MPGKIQRLPGPARELAAALPGRRLRRTLGIRVTLLEDRGVQSEKAAFPQIAIPRQMYGRDFSHFLNLSAARHAHNAPGSGRRLPYWGGVGGGTDGIRLPDSAGEIATARR